MEFSETQITRYSRHILLPEVGGKGQKKIAKGKVLLVGAGGLGSPAALYLAAAGVGTIGLIDSDVVDLSNLQRQVLHHTSDIGRSKVLSGKEKIQALNPDVNVILYEERLNASNALKMFAEFDVIIDGVDNFPGEISHQRCLFLCRQAAGPRRNSSLRRPRDDHHSTEVRLLPMHLQSSPSSRPGGILPGSRRDRSLGGDHRNDPGHGSVEADPWYRSASYGSFARL